jgi:hypothetical protein
MSYKTILSVTGPGFGDGDVKITAALCEEMEAHLSVLNFSDCTCALWVDRWQSSLTWLH